MSRKYSLFMAVFLVVGAGAVQAQAPAKGSRTPEPRTQLEAIDLTMQKTAQYIQNSKAKFNMGVVGIAEPGADAGRLNQIGAPTPAQQCCQHNIEQLDQLMATLRRQLAELTSCHANADRETRDTLKLAAEDTATLGRTIVAFATSEQPERADQAIGGMQRAFILLRKTRANLPDCPLPDPAAPTSPTE